jgi:hypothetical protein
LILALRSHNNNSFSLRSLIFLLLLSLISLWISASCAMTLECPRAPIKTMDDGCKLPMEHHEHVPGKTQTPASHVDCWIKACFDAQIGPVLGFHPELQKLPVLLLAMIWYLDCLPTGRQIRVFPRMASPPDPKRIPLIYRYCSLLI